VVVAIVPFSPWRFTKGSHVSIQNYQGPHEVKQGDAGRGEVTTWQRNTQLSMPKKNDGLGRWNIFWQRSYFSTINCVG
jgi:hypothetical protein